MDHNKHIKVKTSQLLRSSKLSRLGIASCMGLTGLIATTLFCPVSSHVHAAETIPASENVLTSDTANISIAIDDAMVAVNLNPNENNGFAAGSTKVRVTTDNASGYKLSMSTLDGTSNLSRDDAISDYISPVAGIVDSSSFNENTWGYSLVEGDTSGTDFQAVPGSSTNVAETDNADSDTWTLSFGAKVSKTLPAGEYKNKVIISAVANPPVLTGLNRIETMQAMTHEICEQAKVHDSKQLTDVRDGKSYWVTKLADGNCWMTQNLALDLSASNPLTSELTDLGYDDTTSSYPATPKSWTPRTTETTIPTTADTSPDQIRSWNLGTYYELIHDGSKRCGDIKNNLSDCVSQGVIGSTPTSNDGAAGAEGDHYLIGNYYQYATVTAGTGKYATNQARVTDSICPRNWHLATSGTDYSMQSGSFSYLLTQYGVQSSVTGTGLASNPATAGKSYNITQAPLFFTKTGHVRLAHPETGTGTPPFLRGLGSNGYYWSSVLNNYYYDNYANGFHFNDNYTYPVDNAYRGFGYSVRCLAR